MAPKIALVGCGRWGCHILRDLLELGCEVHVVARTSPSRDRAAGAHGVHGTLQELLRTGPVDGAVVATPATWHPHSVMEIVQQAGANLPIFCEKPLAISNREAESMAASAKRLFVMDKWKYHPAVQWMKRTRESGRYGALVGLRARRHETQNNHPEVGPAWTLFPHDLAILQEISGSIPLVLSGRATKDQETVFALLGYQPWAVLECSTTARTRARELTVYFEEAVVSLVDALASTLTVQWGNETNDLTVPGDLPLYAELKAFVGYLGGGPEPRSVASEGVSVVRAISEILEHAHAS